MHQAIVIVGGIIAGVFLVDAGLFLSACFTPPTEFDWEEDLSD